MIQNIVKSIEIQFKNPLFQSIIDIDEIKSHLSELKSYSPEYIIHTEEEDYGRLYISTRGNGICPVCGKEFGFCPKCLKLFDIANKVQKENLNDNFNEFNKFFNKIFNKLNTMILEQLCSPTWCKDFLNIDYPLLIHITDEISHQKFIDIIKPLYLRNKYYNHNTPGFYLIYHNLTFKTISTLSLYIKNLLKNKKLAIQLVILS